MGSPIRILVVEDETRIAEVVQSYLECEGHMVDRAATGEDALDDFSRRRPDLVVLDLGLPGISGEEVCRRIRAGSDVPIIMLTAKDGEGDLVRGLELGADDYLTKPFSPRELTARVRALLRRARSDDLTESEFRLLRPSPAFRAACTRGSSSSARCRATGSRDTNAPSTLTSRICATSSARTHGRHSSS